jgi:glycosyltransferase involved in cell wall biosynthesis
VELNRRLPQELARHGEWDVTAVGPSRFHGDFGWHTLEPQPAEACTVVPVPVRPGRPIHCMLYGRKLSELLREPWDLVHCWEEPYVAAAAQVLVNTPAGVPVVFATFQNIAKHYPPPFSWIERYTMARAAGIVAFGRTSREIVAERAPTDTPVRTISPGVDVQQFAPNPDARARMLHKFGWKDGVAVVGFLGRFVPEKGCVFLTRVLDRLQRPWRAIFVGSGPLERELRTWAEAHGERVRIETQVAHADVPAHLNAMNLLCAPSQTTVRWREQFGRMLIEALSCGVPVIASDSGEIPDVLGGAGVVVGERDEQAWACTLGELLGDPTRLENLSCRGRQMAVERYAWQVIARQHLEFFDEIVDLRRRN